MLFYLILSLMIGLTCGFIFAERQYRLNLKKFDINDKWAMRFAQEDRNFIRVFASIAFIIAWPLLLPLGLIWIIGRRPLKWVYAKWHQFIEWAVTRLPD